MNPLVAASCICSIFVLVQASSSSLAPYAYWSKVFPNTPMPDDIKALLHPEGFSEHERGYNAIIFPLQQGPSPMPRNFFAYRRLWTADIGVSESGHDHPQAFSNDQYNGTKLFFLEENLQPGRKMNVTMLMNHKQGSVFLLPKEVEAIPFSSAKLDTILRMFSIDAGSDDAFIIKETILDCEKPSIKGETKRCASTLEHMIDFVVSQLGTNIGTHVLSSSIVNQHLKIQDGVYKVRVSGVKLISEKAVVCHNMLYPYAVFYCHKLRNTKSYMVSLINEDAIGTGMNAITPCHHDTTHWNPGHASFQMLGVKPGTVPICHFLEEGFAWVLNN